MTEAKSLGATGVLFFNSVLRGIFLVPPILSPLMAEPVVNTEGGAEHLSRRESTALPPGVAPPVQGLWPFVPFPSH